MTEETVGPVVGSISSSSASAAVGWTNDGSGYNCALAGIPFMKAPSDERPYIRETAEFRKEQVDQSRTVGDQSLSGFWTRGQLSFHKGAGINYYEVLDGEAVIDRFTDSLDVDVWTPGEVSVKAPRTEIVSGDAIYGFLHDGGFAAISSAGAVTHYTYAGSPTALADSGAGDPTWLASDGTNLYIAVSNRIERRAPGGAFTTLWTHSTGGRTVSQVFWAKSRLWVIDSAGEWFTLSTVGGTFATGDGNSLWVSGLPSTGWSCADTPGGVFFAKGNLVYESILGTNDTLTVPAVVATLGAHETIGTIGAYLGYLVVASSVGVRMGRIGGASQLALALGDVIVACDASGCRGMGFRDSLVLVTGTVGSDTFLYEVNVLDQVEDLSGAYAPVRQFTDTATAHSALVLPDERVLTMSEDGVELEDAALGDASGYVTTAFHRFGTLELKDFRTVSVYARGTAGSVAVSLIRRDGAEYSLVTLGPANFDSNEVALNLPAAADYVGLKFTIIADGGVAPVLLGYQLRATPAPTRHRMIQVPLQCFDTEKVGNVTRGRKGWAWERLNALEALEQSSGVVRWQDFDTGEVAQVLIDRIRFISVTPSLLDKNGFGGFIMATLRKVA